MLNLLLTDLKRLIKDKVFYIGLIFLAFYGYFKVKETACFDLNNCIRFDGSTILVGIPVLIILFTIFFISLFIGTDYSEGTIRNKIIVGKKRSQIYLSNSIITFLVVTIYFLTYYISIKLGLHHYKCTINIDKTVLKYLLFDGYLLTLAFSSLTVLVSTLYTSKIGSLLSNIIALSLLMLFGARIYQNFIYSKLVNSKQIRLLIEMFPNVQLGFLFEEGYQTMVNYKIMWLGSLFFIVIINIIGILLFEVKDLK